MKDDPLRQAGHRPRTTLWLGQATMQQARENFWKAYQAIEPSSGLRLGDDKHAWDIAWAAAIAAFSYVMEGRIEP